MVDTSQPYPSRPYRLIWRSALQYLLRLHYLAAAETVFSIRSPEPNITVSPPRECTQQLARLSEGDGAALDELWPFVYSELREIAHMRLSRSRPDAAIRSAESRVRGT